MPLRPGLAALLAQSAVSRAVEKFTGDFQVTCVRRCFLNNVQYHHANVRELAVAVAATRHVRQADARQYLVGPPHRTSAVPRSLGARSCPQPSSPHNKTRTRWLINRGSANWWMRAPSG